MKGRRGRSLLPVAVALGDPAGIGPEVVRRVLAADRALAARCRLFGDPAARVPRGRPSREAGALALGWLREAARAVLAGECGALVTGPVSKEAIARTVPSFRGQTEEVARLAGVAEPVMMLAGPRLRAVCVTRHLPVRRIAAAISESLIERAIVTTARDLSRWFRIRRPRIAVAGLNPHAGEGGLLGREDGAIVAPAIRRAVRRGVRATGPHPADVVFREALAGKHDAVVAMYHDQANIPVKTIDGFSAVNVTLGLPFLRVSPAHGTAFDLAGTGQADPSSMRAAIALAAAATARGGGR